MTDQEINEAVAKKLGWTYQKSGVLFGRGHREITENWYRPDGVVNIQGIPDYCHDIALSMKEVVEKFDAMALVKLSSGGWACNPTPPSFDYLVRADTAPMAICLAFLKLQ
jgi:hypothetical protein